MWSKSEIQNCKKLFLDETHCYGQDVAEKAFDEMIEKTRNFDFSEFQDKEEAIVKLFEILEIPAEIAVCLKHNFVNDPALSSEKNFKRALLFGKEIINRIEQKAY